MQLISKSQKVGVLIDDSTASMSKNMLCIGIYTEGGTLLIATRVGLADEFFLLFDLKPYLLEFPRFSEICHLSPLTFSSDA